jgi:hypothetical protein
MIVFVFQHDESSRRERQQAVVVVESESSESDIVIVVVESESSESDIFNETEAEILPSHARQCDESLVAFPDLSVPGFYQKVSYTFTAS